MRNTLNPETEPSILNPGPQALNPSELGFTVSLKKLKHPYPHTPNGVLTGISSLKRVPTFWSYNCTYNHIRALKGLISGLEVHS